MAKPAATNQTTGGGKITALTTAAGTYKGTGDACFSVGMTYNKSGTNLQGKITLAVPQSDGVLYIKSTSISSMAVTQVTLTKKTSTIYTKSAVYKVLTNGSVVTVDGNVTLRLDVSDDGTSDGVGFTVLSSKDSTLYYSNNWALSGGAWQTVLETISLPTFVTVN